MTTVEQAPYDAEGNLLFSPDEYGHDWVREWRANTPFTETMFLDRSGVKGRTVWADAQGHKYTMFPGSFFALAKSFKVNKGIVHGNWIVQKIGRNYGLKYVGEAVYR